MSFGRDYVYDDFMANAKLTRKKPHSIITTKQNNNNNNDALLYGSWILKDGFIAMNMKV